MTPYPPQLLSWAKNKSHMKNLISSPSHLGKAHNKNCGDSLTLRINVDNDVVTNLEYEGESCAISQASSEAMCAYLEGKHTSFILKASLALREAVLEGRETHIEELKSFIFLHPHVSRHKCALLVLDAISQFSSGGHK